MDRETKKKVTNNLKILVAGGRLQGTEIIYLAKKAGYDAVEIHGAHGYLIQEFTSQYSNKRTDEYGGDLLGRAKFSLDIIHNIRSKVGEDYPLIYRMSTDEYLPNGEGLKLPDSLALATMYEEAGIDALRLRLNMVSHRIYQRN